MQELKAVRRLVKSPPELWAQCSNAQLLSRHLNGFGEITITRLEPENTVAWEGESASGTVTLEESGWGTKVRLTATPPGAAAGLEPPVPVSRPAAVSPRSLSALINAVLARRREIAGAVPRGAGEAAVTGGVTGSAAVVAGLEAALDSLGQAHRRPYSRS